MDGAADAIADRAVGSLGEFGLIRAFASRMPAGPYTSLGMGDDSAVVTAPTGSVVVSVDMLLEGRHFRRAWSSGYDVGVKAAARSLADIAAMGARPTALLAAVALPGTLPVAWALDLASGLAYEAGRAGAGIVGGDTASAESVLVSVTALGDMAGAVPVRRSRARPGDVVAVSGTLGHSAAGLALLTAGVTSPATGERHAPVPTPTPEPGERETGLALLVTAHVRPAPSYEAGPLAARAGATAMIDVSDGLIADLGHIAEASGVMIDLSLLALEPFLEPVLTDAAAAVAASPVSRSRGPEPCAAEPCAAEPPDPASPVPPGPVPVGTSGPARSIALGWVLAGGEDHSLVATFPGSASLPRGWRVIGEVREVPSAGAAAKVTVDGRAYAKPGGWEHFR